MKSCKECVHGGKPFMFEEVSYVKCLYPVPIYVGPVSVLDISAEECLCYKERETHP